MPQFRDDPQHPGTRLWQRSRWVTAGSAIGLAVIGLIALSLTAVAVWVCMIGRHWDGFGVGFVVVEVLVVTACWGMVALMWRDFQGKRFARIALDDEGIALDLPRNRSLIHRPPPFHGRFAWSDIARIDTREEAYLSQGMAMLNRPFWLVKRDGSRVLLGEERGVGTTLDQGRIDDLVEEIAGRGKLEVNELPMAEGRGGILGGWFTRPPPLDAPPLSERERTRIRRRVLWTGLIGLTVTLIVFLLQAL